MIIILCICYKLILHGRRITRIMVSAAAFHARVRGSVPGLAGLKETKMFLPHPRVKVSIVGSLRDREVACSASDRQGSNFESCVWRTVSSQSSHHPQEVLLAQFSLYVHKGGLKPDSFHFIFEKLAVPKVWWIRVEKWRQRKCARIYRELWRFSPSRRSYFVTCTKNNYHSMTLYLIWFDRI